MFEAVIYNYDFSVFYHFTFQRSACLTDYNRPYKRAAIFSPEVQSNALVPVDDCPREIFKLGLISLLQSGQYRILFLYV